MTPYNYNFKEIIHGNKFKGLTFILEVNGALKDLTGGLIEMWMRAGSEDGTVVKKFDSNSNGFTITDPTNAEFKLDPFLMTLKPMIYYYDIRFTLADGDPVTYMRGIWPVKINITGTQG